MGRHVNLMIIQSDTDSCARNLGDEQKNEEYEEYIKTTPEENDSIK